MTTTVDGLRLRQVLGRHNWRPPQPYGPDGWALVHRDGDATVIVTAAEQDDGREWVHASIARRDRTPDYADLVLLHKAAFRDQWAYQVFAPREHHVNIHNNALHLWGLVDGQPVTPNFGKWGSI